MHHPRAAVFALATLLAAVTVACTAGGSPPPSQPTQTSGPSGAGVRVEVKLTDELKIEPALINVKAGVPVTFVVTNTGALEHEFFVGSEAGQAAHEKEMMGSAGMIHDEPMGIGVRPGATKELTITFPAAGATLAGCHVPGHYAAGMKATITGQ